MSTPQAEMKRKEATRMQTIAVIPGDGVGPEVIDEAQRVLRRLNETDGIQFDTVTYPFGAEHYLKSGELMPQSVLEEFKQMDAILLGAIGDPRVDKRIDFLGGARGTEGLERAVGSGAGAVAFSLYPVSVSDLMAISDAGDIMPPKSTWFEPKLRDGLLIHEI